MRSILEKALVALLNEEKDRADALFHDFILERSRQIHESLRQGEDFILDESLEDELAIDEMFSEADLADDEVEELEVDGDELVEFEGDADDFTADDGEEASADVVAVGDEEGVDGEVEGEEEPETIEDRVESLEDELARLAAEFDAMMGGEEEVVPGDDTDMAGEIEGDDEFEGEEESVTEGTLEIVQHGDGELDLTHHIDGDESGDSGLGMGNMDIGGDATFGDDMTTDLDTLGDDDLGGDEFGADDLETDIAKESEEFDDLSESAVDELEKVNVKHSPNMEQGGKTFTQNNTSLLKNHPVGDRAFKGEPVKIKSVQVNGYPEPKQIASKKIEKRQNVLNKADERLTSVKKEGNAKAELNKLKADPAGQKSPLTPVGSKKK